MHTKMDKVKDIKNELIDWVDAHKDSARAFDAIGEAIEMIEDLAKTEKACWEACYYKSIVEVMEESKEEEKVAMRMGYNPNRSASTGRYTSGYTDPVTMGPYARHMDHMMTEMQNRMGYTADRPYDRYNDAKRSYTESHNAADKQKMDHHAQEHVKECCDTMRDIWHNASPELKARMKQDLTNLINDMK